MGAEQLRNKAGESSMNNCSDNNEVIPEAHEPQEPSENQDKADGHSVREGELLNKLIKQDARLQKLQKERNKLKKEKDILEKNHKTITRSKLWKLSWPVRKSLHFLNRTGESVQSLLLGSKYKLAAEENKTLMTKNRRTQRELAVVQEKLKTAQEELDRRKKRETELSARLNELDEGTLTETVYSAAENGEIVQCLDDIIRNRTVHDEKFSTALKAAARLYINKDDEIKHTVYHHTLRGLKIEEIPEFMMRSAELQGKLSLDHVSSFKACLSMRMRQRQLEEFMPEYILDQKGVAYSFIDHLDVRRPWVSDQRFKFSELPRKEGIVVKPFEGAGGRGVYLVHAENKIQDVKRSQMLESWEELETFIKMDLASEWVFKDEWITEELMFEDGKEEQASRDFKFYCFYGRVALILEILRFPEIKYCWWTADGQLVSTGKYEDQAFTGAGVSTEHVELAKSISSEIPAPFIRIDFLKKNEELVFGEFTPKPGNYDHFNKTTDRLLGEYYLEAEGRLIKDLLKGKPFEHFNKLVSSLKF